MDDAFKTLWRVNKYQRRKKKFYTKSWQSFILLISLQISFLCIYFLHVLAYFPSDFICPTVLHFLSLSYNSDFSLNQIWLHWAPFCDNLLLQIDPTSWPTLLFGSYLDLLLWLKCFLAARACWAKCLFFHCTMQKQFSISLLLSPSYSFSSPLFSPLLFLIAYWECAFHELIV